MVTKCQSRTSHPPTEAASAGALLVFRGREAPSFLRARPAGSLKPPFPVPFPPFTFLTLLLEVLAGASAGPGYVVPCATLTFELEVICGAFYAHVSRSRAQKGRRTSPIREYGMP